jgi:putative membrane protein
MPPERRFDEHGDATRRTWLANERTFLAWLRSGLTSLAVAFGVGKVVPELAGGTNWPYVVAGVGYSLLGLAFIVLGYRRQRAVDDAIQRGEYARIDPRTLTALTIGGVVLALLTLVLVVVES